MRWEGYLSIRWRYNEKHLDRSHWLQKIFFRSQNHKNDFSNIGGLMPFMQKGKEKSNEMGSIKGS